MNSWLFYTEFTIIVKVAKACTSTVLDYHFYHPCESPHEFIVEMIINDLLKSTAILKLNEDNVLWKKRDKRY